MSGVLRQYHEQERTSSAMDHALQNFRQPKQTHKRKRASPDHNDSERNLGTRPNASPATMHRNGNNISDVPQSYFEDAPDPSSNNLNNISQQIARHAANANVMPTAAAAALAASMPQLTVPQPTELSFPSTNSGNDDERQLDSSFDMSPPDNPNRHTEGTPYNLDAFTANGTGQVSIPRDGSSNGGNKPAVGSDEWHKVRRDNHKEVERRRRETINEGINELAKIVPGCDKNKGAILQRGVSYITSLKDNEERNIEKWTLEKLVNDQAIGELSSSVDKLKGELERAYKETERWKRTCQQAGLDPGGDTSDT